MELSDCEERREKDAERFRQWVDDECQLCGAFGPDKRTLFVDCLYEMQEAVPEMADISGIELDRHRAGFALRICKDCRGRLLGKLREWRGECLAKRGTDMDEDGHLMEEKDGIPVRVDGRIVYMTLGEYELYRTTGIINAWPEGGCNGHSNA